MQTIEVIALGLVAVWLAGLTLLQLTTIRQIGILMARSAVGGSSEALAFLNADGPEIGSEVPDKVTEIVRETNAQESAGNPWFLLVSATCGSCRQLMSDIHQHGKPDAFTVLIAGSKELSSQLRQLVPPKVGVIGDPAASTFARELHIRSTPFLVKITENKVVDKAYVFDHHGMVEKFRM